MKQSLRPRKCIGIELTFIMVFFVNFVRVDDVLNSFVIEDWKQNFIKSWISLTLHQAITCRQVISATISR